MSGFLNSKGFRLLAGTAIGIGSLVIALRSVSLDEILSVFNHAKLEYIVLIFCSVNLNTMAKAIRWYLIANRSGHTHSFPWIFYIFTFGQMMNWVYPARAGDFGRVLLLGKKDSSEVYAVGTLVIEKLHDAAYLVILAALLPWFLPIPDWLVQPLKGSVILVFTILFGIVVLLVHGRNWVGVIKTKLDSNQEKWAVRVRTGLSHLTSGLDSLEIVRHPKDMVLVNLLTMLGWLTAAMNVYWSFRALSLPLAGGVASWGATLLVMVSLQLGIAVPAVPGRIGIFELICVLALSIFHIPETLSLSFGILLHSLVMFPIILIGLASLIKMSITKVNQSNEKFGMTERMYPHQKS